jgi:N-acetylglucosamine-6-phosphate deacetylase
MDGKLAGSVLTMDRAVRNVTHFAGWTLQAAVRAASMNATLAVGLARHGQLVQGAEANVVVLSPSGEVLKTIVRACGL